MQSESCREDSELLESQTQKLVEQLASLKKDQLVLEENRTKLTARQKSFTLEMTK